MWKVTDSIIRKDNPIAHADIIVHVFEKERGKLAGGRGMRPPEKGLVFFADGPRLATGRSWDAVGGKTGEVWSHRVRKVGDMWVDGGRMLTCADEGVPAQRVEQSGRKASGLT